MASPANPALDPVVAAVRAELERQASASQQPTQPQPPHDPWRVKIGGQELQFNDPTTLQAQLDAQQAAFDARLAEMGRAAQQPQPDPTPEPAAPPADGVKPEVKRFAETFIDDPATAILQALESKLGPNFFGIVAQSAVQTAELRQNIAVDQFVRNHDDYVASPKNAETLQKIMETNNLPVTPQSLELAWGYAKSQGLVELPPAQQPAASRNVYQMPQQPAQSSSSPFPAPQAPPHPGRSAGGYESADAIMGDLHKLDRGTLAKIIADAQRYGG